ncbi:MAG: zinc-binding dehydrogenase, partial [Nitrospiraceae bacterium]|nr:zinc-binding dehydrogenase [Nitrospiraceae bacterium]
ATEFGATDIVEARGEGAVQRVLELTDGWGVDSSMECVGTTAAIETAFAIAKAGSTVGVVGVPHGGLSFGELFSRNIGWKGGPAPARIYIPELLEDVLAGRINPGRVFDYETDLEGTPDAYAAMDGRRAIKSLIRVGSL